MNDAMNNQLRASPGGDGPANCNCNAARGLAVLLVAMVLLAGCGGGGGRGQPDPGPDPTVTLIGTAAAGSPLAGGTLRVIDSHGKTQVLAGTIGDDGTYSLDVTGLTPPLLVVAEGRIGESTGELVAVEPTGVSSGTLTVNVTPMTHAIASLVEPGGNPRNLLQAANLAAVVPNQVALAVSALNTALAQAYALAGVSAAGFNPMSTPFQVGREGQDRLLDMVRVELGLASVIFTNATLPLDANGVPPLGAVVTLTPSNLNSPPVMAAGSASVVPDDLAWLRQAFDACFALAAAERAGAAACSALFDPAYLADGYPAAQRWLLADAAMEGARFAVPELLFVQVDPVNGASMPVVRLAWSLPNGRTGARIDVLRNFGTPALPDWRLHGNQRDIDMVIEPRLVRSIERNRAFNGDQYLT
jgi:hypothetical protein